MEYGLKSQETLRNLLTGQCRELRKAQTGAFRDWLAPLIDRWQRNPAFQIRVEIRDIRHNSPLLIQLEQELRLAERQDREALDFAELTQTERELANTAKAIQGLQQARQEAQDDRRKQALEEKLSQFLSRHQQLERGMAELIAANPQRQRLLQLREQLDRLRQQLGLVEREERLAALLKQGGRHSGQAGEDFETRAVEATHRFILPRLQDAATPPGRLRVLTGVTLGAARLELDQLVIRLPDNENDAVQVLALVESKRNINDLAQGFRQRQENLAWLTGDSQGYDPELYRNRQFPDGHFDREVRWEQDGQTFRFRPESFRLFRRDESGHFLERLYFITRPGPLWGISSAGLSRIQYRVATDTQWQPDDEGYLQTLLHWCQELTEPLETPDLLRLYAESPARAGQIILLS